MGWRIYLGLGATLALATFAPMAQAWAPDELTSREPLVSQSSYVLQMVSVELSDTPLPSATTVVTVGDLTRQAIARSTGGRITVTPMLLGPLAVAAAGCPVDVLGPTIDAGNMAYPLIDGALRLFLTTDTNHCEYAGVTGGPPDALIVAGADRRLASDYAMHEIGHLWGLEHSTAAQCPFHRYVNDCVAGDEYGDVVDVMGSGSSNDGFGPFALDQLGVARRIVIGTDQNVTVPLATTASAGVPIVAVVPFADGSGALFLQARQGGVVCQLVQMPADPTETPKSMLIRAGIWQPLWRSGSFGRRGDVAIRIVKVTPTGSVIAISHGDQQPPAVRVVRTNMRGRKRLVVVRVTDGTGSGVMQVIARRGTRSVPLVRVFGSSNLYRGMVAVRSQQTRVAVEVNDFEGNSTRLENVR